MSFDKVASGFETPNDINVIIETPAFSDPVNFEVDIHKGLQTVDRFMGTPRMDWIDDVKLEIMSSIALCDNLRTL